MINSRPCLPPPKQQNLLICFFLRCSPPPHSKKTLQVSRLWDGIPCFVSDWNLGPHYPDTMTEMWWTPDQIDWRTFSVLSSSSSFCLSVAHILGPEKVNPFFLWRGGVGEKVGSQTHREPYCIADVLTLLSHSSAVYISFLLLSFFFFALLDRIIT